MKAEKIKFILLTFKQALVSWEVNHEI